MTKQTQDDLARALEDMRARVSALEAAVQRQATAAPAAAAPPQSSGAQKDLESAIDQMVASALLRGRHTADVLNGMFNLSPGLSGR